MSIFHRQHKEDIRLEPTQQSRVEIELHKNASKEAKQKADEVNNHVRDLLGENGFTVKIFLAAGHHLPIKAKGGSGS